MPKYTVNHDGFIDNVYRKEGETVTYHERAARYLVAPYGDNLTLFVEPTVAADAKPAKARRKEAADE
ncbi:hypothetical protein [Mesorhizobium sp. Cs1299R1N3]|uniref:hypothetical protein n=1 Tax=Mesorhizobium sp. Cs1299R1N3 TaxID=3015173 RepID=UPI00301C96CE